MLPPTYCNLYNQTRSQGGGDVLRLLRQISDPELAPSVLFLNI